MFFLPFLSICDALGRSSILCCAFGRCEQVDFSPSGRFAGSMCAALSLYSYVPSTAQTRAAPWLAEASGVGVQSKAKAYSPRVCNGFGGLPVCDRAGQALECCTRQVSLPARHSSIRSIRKNVALHVMEKLVTVFAGLGKRVVTPRDETPGSRNIVYTMHTIGLPFVRSGAPRSLESPEAPLLDGL